MPSNLSAICWIAARSPSSPFSINLSAMMPAATAAAWQRSPKPVAERLLSVRGTNRPARIFRSTTTALEASHDATMLVTRQP